MKKYIVLSVNDNPDYSYFTPIVSWAWRKIGWEPIVMCQFNGDLSDTLRLAFEGGGYNAPDSATGNLKHVLSIDGYRSDTITQISRLYAGARYRDSYLMTGDIDMIPLSDYWNPNENNITCYGHDLTGYGHYPICYIGMPSTRWVELMGLTSTDYNKLIKRDLDTLPQAKDPDFYKYWFCDQDLITKRLADVTFPITVINRGQYSNGFARGRVDRGAWSLNHKEFIDAHLHQQMYHKGREEKFNQTLDLLYKIWPNENFDWFVEYTHEFRKLTGHA